MKRYRVQGVVTISCFVTVTAKSKAEARRLAEEASMQQLCNYCASGDEGVWSTSGELDGTPHIEKIEVER